MSACMRWCCYEDPYGSQCDKIVKKGSNHVRCRRKGIHYDKVTAGYYCYMHYPKKHDAVIDEYKRRSYESCSSSSTE